MSALIDWNPSLVIALITLFSAQMIKFVGHWITRRAVDFTRLTGMGGMPSSHAASVSALSTVLGLERGWDSPVFGGIAFLSLLIIYDATGIRQAAAAQARVLNRMLEDLKAHHTLGGERVSELLGHTVVEVVAGAAYGVALALLLYR